MAMKRMLLFLSLLQPAIPSFALAPLPSDSIYQMPLNITAQDGTPIEQEIQHTIHAIPDATPSAL